MIIAFSILFNLLTGLLALRRTKTWLNPFSGIMAFFALSGFFALNNPLIESPNVTSELGPETEWFVLIFSAGFFALTFALRPKPFRQPGIFQTRPLPMTGMLIGGFVVCLVGTVMLLRRNGGVPVFLMSQSFAAGKGTSYQDFLIPFVTPLTWGVCRFMFILLCIDYLTRNERLVSHLMRNWLGYGLALFSLLMVLAGALRNALIWPVAFYLFGFARKFGVSRGQTLMIGGVLAAVTVFFVLVGNYRMGSISLSETPMESMMVTEVNNPMLRSIYSWLASYSGTCYLNLNAMIQVPPEPGYGLVLLTELVPDSLIEDFVTIPESGIEYLSGNNLLPYFGLTFRTIFTDLYADFGYVGSLIAGLALYGFSIVAFNRAGTSHRWLCLYVCLLPGLLMFPFLNFFAGLASLAPLALTFACVNFRPAKSSSAEAAPALVRSVQAHGSR